MMNFGGFLGGASNPMGGGAQMQDDVCQERSCTAFGQRSQTTVEGGETYCSACGTKMSSSRKFDNELDFGQNSAPAGVFLREG